jgi:hypothetical protein
VKGEQEREKVERESEEERNEMVDQEDKQYHVGSRATFLRTQPDF